MGQPAAGAGENAPPLRRVVHVRGGPASATQQYFTAADDFFIRPAARRQPQGQNEGIFYIFFFFGRVPCWFNSGARPDISAFGIPRT